MRPGSIESRMQNPIKPAADTLLGTIIVARLEINVRIRKITGTHLNVFIVELLIIITIKAVN